MLIRRLSIKYVMILGLIYIGSVTLYATVVSQGAKVIRDHAQNIHALIG